MLIKYIIYGNTGEFICPNVAISECKSVSYDKENGTVSLLLYKNIIFIKEVSELTYNWLIQELWEKGKLNLTVLNLKYDVYFNPNDIKYRAAYWLD